MKPNLYICHTAYQVLIDLLRASRTDGQPHTMVLSAAVPEPQVDFTKGVAAGSATQELEKELLKYLLKYGHRNFDFKEGRDVIQMNVADVILSTLDAQELHFQTEVYRKMLDTYRERRSTSLRRTTTTCRVSSGSRRRFMSRASRRFSRRVCRRR